MHRRRGLFGALLAIAMLVVADAPASYASTGDLTVFRDPLVTTPSSVAVGPDGEIWFADPARDQLSRLSPESGDIQRFPVGPIVQFPRAITVGDDSDVWFVDGDEWAISRLDPSTGLVSGYGLGDDEGNEIYALATGPDGTIWFALVNPSGIGSVDPGSGEITVLPDPDMELNLAYGLAVGADGSIWQNLFGTPLGEGLRRWDPVTGDTETHLVPVQEGQQFGTLTITLDAQGDPWLAANDLNQLLQFDPTTETFISHPLPAEGRQPFNLVTGLDGSFWFTNRPDARVVRFDPTTGTTASWLLPGPLVPSADWGPESLAVAPDGTLWLVAGDYIAQVHVDTAAPSVVIDTPVAGAAIARGANVTADYTCTDETGGDGLASCTGDLADGAAIDTSTVGEHSFTVTGRDRAGNSTTVTHTYIVAPSECNGRSVTVDLHFGDLPTPGDDVILGTAASDTIRAGAGEDVVCAGAGDDTVDGGVGRDRVLGGTGRDLMRAQGGGGALLGGAGVDELRGGGGDDVLRGGTGPDALHGGPGSDTLDGGTQRDTCLGGEGVNRYRYCELP